MLILPGPGVNGKKVSMEEVKVSALFRTNEKLYEVPTSSLLIPVSSSPSNMTSLINHMLGREGDDAVEFSFFVQGSLIQGSLHKTLQALEIGVEAQVLIEYSPSARLPEAERTDRLPDWVRCVRACQRSSTVLTGSFDSIIRVFDATCKLDEPLHTLSGHTACVTDMAWIGQEQKFVSSSNDRTLRIWNLEEETKCQAVLKGHEGTLQCVVATKDVIVSGDYNGQIGFWSTDTSNATTPHENKPKKSKKKVQALLPSEPTMTASTLLDGHGGGGPVSALAIDHFQNTAVSAGYDHKIKRWDLESCKVITSWELGTPVAAMTQSRQSSTWAVAKPDGSVRLLDFRSDPNQQTPSPSSGGHIHEGWINKLAWSPLSENLLCSTGADMRVCLWDRRGLGSGPLKVLSEAGKKMLALDWSPTAIYFGGEDCILHTHT